MQSKVVFNLLIFLNYVLHVSENDPRTDGPGGLADSLTKIIAADEIYKHSVG